MVHFFIDLLTRIYEIPSYHVRNPCQGGSICQVSVCVFSSEQILATLAALPNEYVHHYFCVLLRICDKLFHYDQRNIQETLELKTRHTSFLFLSFFFFFFFSAEVKISRAVAFCFQVVLKKPCYNINNNQVFIEKMKCELDVVSAHQQRFDLKTFSSFPIFLLESALLFLNLYSLLLSDVNLIVDLSAPKFALCPHLVFVVLTDKDTRILLILEGYYVI